MFNMSDYGFVKDIKCGKVINGKFKTDKAYNRWYSIIARCYDSSRENYKRYGAKGVVVCEEWKIYSNFKKWFDENYIDGYDIDKDINGGKIYSPDNCIFVSRKDNSIEANSRMDYSYHRGDNHCFAKDKKYYETHSSKRGVFKQICKRRGWIFEDFEEIFSGEIMKYYEKRYYYKDKGDK